jgi:hypothetical protein
MRRQAAALLLVSMLGPACALAQARTYAVLSLVGDRLLLVSRDGSTGSSRIDSNTKRFIALGNSELDRTVLAAVDAAVRMQVPGAEVVLLETRDPEIFSAQARALDAGGGGADILPAVRDIAAGSKATHLVLVTKQRHEAMLNVSDGHIGSGSLEGLGFYIDRDQRLTNLATGAGFVGFLAPFAYFRVSLVEVASGKVLGEEAVYASLIASRQSVSHPWDALTPKQKVEVIEGMLRAEVARVIPLVLEGR